MQNDPELDPKYLGTITEDFAVVSNILRESSYQVRKRGFSEYPIFPVSKTQLPVGQLLLAKEELALQWNYYITYLDEFVQRKLIDQERVEEFEKNYKDPEEFCCLFVVDGDFTRYVYIPYPEDSPAQGL
ncbi:hypothetical protein AB9P05_04725 [Roseivirga sp. BDSF3-8]|uniref:hypothetical protein n=1 Tax=Roseivirga sp. BDSF3-8 TaxID=3241598 RepID=UPI0035319E88